MSTTTWLVELELRNIPSLAGPRHDTEITLITGSYDGTAEGAEQWAADVYDYCDVYVRSVRQVYGKLIEARSEGRLDEVAFGTTDVAEPTVATPPKSAVADGRGGWVESDSHGRF